MQLTVCPHLGLLDDPTLTRTAATRAHRCYATEPPSAPDLDHQATYCLAAACRTCLLFPAPGVVAAPAAPATWLAPAAPPPGRGRPRLLGWLWIAAAALLFAAVVAVAVTAGRDWLRPPAPAGSAAPAIPTATAVPDAPPATTTPLPAEPPALAFAFPTPTPEPGGQTLALSPRAGDAGWSASGDSRANHLGDSFLYAGQLDGTHFLSIVRFDLARAARGAPILDATLRLTGLDDRRFDGADPGLWLVQLLAATEAEDLARADYVAAYSLPAAITLEPLRAADLRAGQVNEFVLDATARAWLERQLLDGATALSVRLLPASDATATLFAWDSGLGSQSAGAPPELRLTLGPPPPTPPPLPTRPYIVATLTPPPANVVTAVAMGATATANAQTTGTNTPLPYQVVTPTPFPQNLATVQAVALSRGLPPVLVDTPTPANAATAAYHAEYATAVALTTGTFTPVPADYVTPVVIAPEAPAENVATAAARVLALTATAEAAAGLLLPTATPTPWPYNAVLGVYVYATPAPENAATAIAMDQQLALIAQTTGTPTALPWNAIVITKVPPPAAATPTPVPLFIGEADFTATPTPTETTTPPGVLPDAVRGKILFKSDRGGGEGTYMLDPATGAVTLITQGWVYALAREQLAASPGVAEQAVVRADDKGILQIQIYAPAYNSMRQITTLRGASYDPAWSPAGGWIAFVSTDSGGDEIYRVDPAGTATQRLTFNAWEWDKHPSWSPDGSRIVFYSNRDTGRRQLWLMAADGSDQQNLSNNAYNDWDPVWVR